MSEENSQIKYKKGTILGSAHRRVSLNNQDALLLETFNLKINDEWKRCVLGFVSDGCTNQHAYSRNEVASNISVVYCYSRLQEMLLSGISPDCAVDSLGILLPDMLRTVNQILVSSDTYWPYPKSVNGHEYVKAPARLSRDYLAATVLGFCLENESLTYFTAGDGCVVVGDELTVIDQNDQPCYPITFASTGKNVFTKNHLDFSAVKRFILASDGLKELLSCKDPLRKIMNLKPVEDHVHHKELGDMNFLEAVYGFHRDKKLGLQYLLNLCSDKIPELVTDDSTIIALDYIGG